MLPSKNIECPYCGESIELIIDDSVESQQYVEDCSVCCRPISVEVSVDDSSGIELICRTDNET
jgi:hypothetical protein